MYKMAFSSMRLTEKLPAEDYRWPQFNASFVNKELPLIEIANEIYSGYAFTTWHKNHWRHTDNYQLGQHIGLDFDTGDKFSTLQHLKRDKFIECRAAMIYTTPSHTPDRPRARVVFTLDTPIYQPQNYVLAATSLVWMFGKADAKCKDAARFFYGSSHCDVEYLENVLPIEIVKNLIQRYKESGEKTKKIVQDSTNLDANHLTDSVIEKIAEGERNSLGFWLACRLAESGCPMGEAERQLLRYQKAATNVGRTPYSEHEAMQSVMSAYRAISRTKEN